MTLHMGSLTEAERTNIERLTHAQTVPLLQRAGLPLIR